MWKYVCVRISMFLELFLCLFFLIGLFCSTLFFLFYFVIVLYLILIYEVSYYFRACLHSNEIQEKKVWIWVGGKAGRT